MITADATTLVAMSLAHTAGTIKMIVGRVTVGEITAREIKETIHALDPDCAVPDEEVMAKTYIDISAPTLSRAESEFIHLSRGEDVRLALSDDPIVREELDSIGIRALGTPGLLYAGKKAGLIEEVPPLLDRLSEVGYGFADECRTALLQELDE
ncbi:MAG: hypothetical protein ACOCR1_04885 [Planctomycetota bacterium]